MKNTRSPRSASLVIWLRRALGYCACAVALHVVAVCAQAPVYQDRQNLLYWLSDDGASHPVRSTSDWERRRAHIRSGVQLAMGELHQRADLPSFPWDVVSDEIDGNVRRRKVSYVVDSPRRRMRAWLLTPADADGSPWPAVLCLHQTVAIGKDEPVGLGGNPRLHYALELAKKGYATLSPDYPSFGENDDDFSDARYSSGSIKAIGDNIRAVDLLSSCPEIDPERLAVIGHSLGGHNAIFTAFFEPRLRAVVSCCGFTRFHKYYQGNLKGWSSNRYMPLVASRFGNNPDAMPFDFTELIGALAPRPFLAVAPLRDANFDVDGVRDVIAAATPIYKLFDAESQLQSLYPECEHDFPDDARFAAYRFLDERLSHRPRTSP